MPTPGLHKLRPYQLEAGIAIVDSVANQRGLTFVLEFSRQSGKNELSAQIETALLTSYAVQPLHIIKGVPTFTPQGKISVRRLRDSLRAAHVPFTTEGEYATVVGLARQLTLSADPNAGVVGHTADLLLEIDEAQDVDEETYDKKFRPMGANTNVTTVLYGTAWLETDLLHRERLAAERAQATDSRRRSFIVTYNTVAQVNPPYAKYVAAERARLGPSHPLFTTQYLMQPLPGGGRLFDPTALAQLRGDHARALTPPLAATLIAGLDIAGSADSAAAARSHDRTVLTLGAVSPPGSADPLQDNHTAILHHLAWQGVPHETLVPQLIDILRNVWPCAAVVVDATGIGETTARLLARSTQQRTTVVPLKYTQNSKSELGFNLQAAVSTGRCKMYADDGTVESRTFWDEARLCRAEYRANQTLDFFVAETDGHDDYLNSLALLVEAARTATPRIARGRTT